MQAWMIYVPLIVIAILLIIIRVVYELHHPRIVNYVIKSKKIEKEAEQRFVFLSDMHSKTYGKDNEVLVNLIMECRPDYILLGGDMITGAQKEGDEAVYGLLKSICRIAPVFYAPGNHEKKLQAYDAVKEHGRHLCQDKKKNLQEKNKIMRDRYSCLKKICALYGIDYLENRKIEINSCINLYGLDVDNEFYKKRQAPVLKTKHIEEKLSVLDRTKYNILLAHNPSAFRQYAEYGADLVLSGHYHGGVIRFPFGRGLITPRFLMNSNYTWGTFIKEDTRMIVTVGIGTHGVNLRLFNRPEVVSVEICSKD